MLIRVGVVSPAMYVQQYHDASFRGRVPITNQLQCVFELIDLPEHALIIKLDDREIEAGLLGSIYGDLTEVLLSFSVVQTVPNATRSNEADECN